MEKCLIYIHGKGGSPAEAEHYTPLFPEHEIIGLDYRATTPWEAGRELRSAIETRCGRFGERILAANSIGAFFAMHAGIDALVRRAYFISPIVDMEALIRGMMASAGVTERELKARGEIPTAFGETLSWEYLRYVRSHPIRWSAPTRILYGSRDEMTSHDAVAAFAARCGAELTVMDGGEHWFHTPEQMAFLDAWIRDSEAAR